MKTRDLFIKATELITQRINDLKAQDYSSLESRITESGETEDVAIDGISITITTWGKMKGDLLGIVVEARRKRFLGWSQVTADGFFLSPDGQLKAMEEKDFWDYGY